MKKKTKKHTHKTKVKGKLPELWPLERGIFFRPERMNYVRKLLPKTGCVFCTAVKQEISFENLCLYKTEKSMIVLNKFPYNSGHLLVLPQAHGHDFLDLDPQAYVDLHHVLRLAFKAITDLYSPAGINIGMNHGAVAGAGIPEHLHYHLVPRWSGDLNFFPLIANTKLVIETLEQSYEKFQKYFAKNHMHPGAGK